MAEANELALYKNSDLNGTPLPLAILLNLGLLKQAFTAAAVNAIAIPATAELLVIYGDELESCLVQMDAAAAIPANGAYVTDLHYIPSGAIKVIDRNGAEVFGVISFTGNAGTVIVEFARAYKDARRPKQHSNI